MLYRFFLKYRPAGSARSSESLYPSVTSAFEILSAASSLKADSVRDTFHFSTSRIAKKGVVLGIFPVLSEGQFHFPDTRESGICSTSQELWGHSLFLSWTRSKEMRILTQEKFKVPYSSYELFPSRHHCFSQHLKKFANLEVFFTGGRILGQILKLSPVGSYKKQWHILEACSVFLLFYI